LLVKIFDKGDKKHRILYPLLEYLLLVWYPFYVKQGFVYLLGTYLLGTFKIYQQKILYPLLVFEGPLAKLFFSFAKDTRKGHYVSLAKEKIKASHRKGHYKLRIESAL